MGAMTQSSKSFPGVKINTHTEYTVSHCRIFSGCGTRKNFAISDKAGAHRKAYRSQLNHLNTIYIYVCTYVLYVVIYESMLSSEFEKPDEDDISEPEQTEGAGKSSLYLTPRLGRYVKPALSRNLRRE